MQINAYQYSDNCVSKYRQINISVPFIYYIQILHIYILQEYLHINDKMKIIACSLV